MKNLLLMIFVMCVAFTKAQNPDIKRTNHWYFGNGAGLDFSNGTVVADTTGHLYTYEGCSSISDSLGNLQFYTDGDTVWNKNHHSMPNGYGLMGCGNWGSSTQHIIVPKPNSSTIFYVFTNDCWSNAGAQGSRYSIVDLNADSGNGDVISKNNLLYAPSTEGVAATKHSNGTDYWIVTHEYNNNRFHSYLLSSSGLDTTPVISQTGYLYNYYVTMFAFSPNGKMLAAAPMSTLCDQLFLFNDTTGIISNPINIVGYGTEYSPRFSPDNSKLYWINSGNLILQYCISNYDSVSINQSRVVFYVVDNSSFGAIQVGPDNKFYISSIYHTFISTIDFPNNYGSACGLHLFNISLNGFQSALGLPNFVGSFMNNDTMPNLCDSVTSINKYNDRMELNVFPNPTNGIITIEMNNEWAKAIKVFDILGNLIYEQKTNFKKQCSIDLADKANGIYIISVLTNNNNYIIKLIKN